MDRRRFLKHLGLGTLAAGSTPTLVAMFTTSGLADDRPTNFHFDCQAKGPTVGGVVHRVAMGGDGKITDTEVVGDGAFIHFNGNPLLPFPKPLIASGVWKARRLISFVPHGTYGVFEAGKATFEIDLVRLIPSRAVVPAKLTVTCNIGAGGPATNTGDEEGIVLHVDGLTFGPLAGLTVFTTAVEERH